VHQGDRRADLPDIVVVADRPLPEAQVALWIERKQRGQAGKVLRMPDCIGIHGRHQNVIDVVTTLIHQPALDPARRPGLVGRFALHLTGQALGMNREVHLGKAGAILRL